MDVGEEPQGEDYPYTLDVSTVVAAAVLSGLARVRSQGSGINPDTVRPRACPCMSYLASLPHPRKK